MGIPLLTKVDLLRKVKVYASRQVAFLYRTDYKGRCKPALFVCLNLGQSKNLHTQGLNVMIYIKKVIFMRTFWRYTAVVYGAYKSYRKDDMGQHISNILRV